MVAISLWKTFPEKGEPAEILKTCCPGVTFFITDKPRLSEKNLQSIPFFKRLVETARAGTMCPPVPPAASITRLDVIICSNHISGIPCKSQNHAYSYARGD